MITKSMPYHYPAEFIVPTNIPFDVGPIGKAFETEFLTQEVEVGLQLGGMLQGLLTVGGTEKERFLTNFNLVYEAAIAEARYLILTTNKAWRRLLDIIPDASVVRLGEDITFNPLDFEDGDPIMYAKLLAQVFAQTLHLSQIGFERLVELLQSLMLETTTASDIEVLRGKIEDVVKEQYTPGKAELSTIHQFLLNTAHGRPSLIFGQTAIPFRSLMEGVTIIEIDVEAQHHLQFILLCLLAKTLSYGYTHQNERCMVLVDVANSLVVMDPTIYKSREVHHHLRDWIKRFNQYGIGLHLSMQSPSLFPPTMLNVFQIVLAHRITAWEDLKIVKNLLHFLPDSLVHSRERHDNYQMEYLKTLPLNTFILKREDILNAFPVQIHKMNIKDTRVRSDIEVQERLRNIFSEWQEPIPEERTVIEMDFGRRNTPLIFKILSLLQDYKKLTRQGMLSSLNSDPGIDLDQPALDFKLHRLVNLGYILPNEWEDRQGHRHQSYERSEKGERVYDEYIEELRRRARGEDTPQS